MNEKVVTLCIAFFCLYSPFSSSTDVGEILQSKEVTSLKDQGMGLEDSLLSLSVDSPMFVTPKNNKEVDLSLSTSPKIPLKEKKQKKTLPAKLSESNKINHTKNTSGTNSVKKITSINRLVSDANSSAQNTRPVQIKNVWKIERGGNLYNTLSEWALKAGWTVVWDSKLNYSILTSVTFSGDFTSAVKQLFSAKGMNNTRLNIKFYKGNKVLLVTSNSF